MRINPFLLKKAELVEVTTKKCKHNHLYIEHPNCWYEEKERKPKIGYFDIETTGTNAVFSYMITYSIKTRDKDEFKTGVIERDDIRSFDFDRNLCERVIKDLQEYDIICTFYGTKFDMPFTRSRCLKWDLGFPIFGYIQHKDIYYMARNKLCLHRNRLESACAFLGIRGKTYLDGDTWIKAGHGHRDSLEYVLEHNIQDTIILEKLHKRLEEFVRPNTRSI
jgi:uncharacterized protein YprB with RNaseH-like and TPR domain